jgi:hypothetical protein
MLALQSIAVGLTIAAALIYALFLYRDRGLPDNQQISAIVSWVLLALVLLVVVQTLSACPSEHGGIKAFYVGAVLLMLANAVTEVMLGSKDRDSDTARSLTWVSVAIAIVVVLIAAGRTGCWERNEMRLQAVRGQYRMVPGDDRVAVAEDVLLDAGYSPRRMKRMLRSLEKAQRK